MSKVLSFLISFMIYIPTSHASNDGWVNLDSEPSKKSERIQGIIMHPSIVQAQYQIAKDLTDVFKDKEIPYTILFGTQLGASRTNENEGGGLIPWDDDFDTGIDIQDLEKVKDLSPIFEEMGYDLIEDGEKIVGYKLVSRENINIKTDTIEIKDFRPFVDIFLYTLNGYYYELYFEKGRQLHKRSPLKKDTFLKRKPYAFGPLTVMGLENDKEHLNSFYPGGFPGEWNILGVYCFSHSTNSTKTKYVWKLTEEDKRPILPENPLKENYLDYKKGINNE